MEPCPVSIKPSPEVYPIAALSPADVSAFGSIVVPVTEPVATIVEPAVNAPLTSAVPLISIAVAVKSISSVAPIDITVALEPCTN